MRLLLGSGGISTPERRQAWVEQFVDFLGPVKRVLFVAYAVHDEAGHTKALNERLMPSGIKLAGIHEAADPLAAVAAAEAIFVTGGNTFRLVKRLYDTGLIAAVPARVHAGMPYIGVSAGTNVACPTMCTTNDMPICWPESLRRLASCRSISTRTSRPPASTRKGSTWCGRDRSHRDCYEQGAADGALARERRAP